MRIKGFDFLRGVAVILVMYRHGDYKNTLQFIGWAGVDLFFVLSGFLVSGLVFKEYTTHGKVNVKRFLIRRGFKIYPAFYFFVLFSILLFHYQTGQWYGEGLIFNEIFYLQNYREGMFVHTWSLAVEEHFYFGFALFIFLCLRFHVLNNKRFMIGFFIGLLALTFLMRFMISFQNMNERFFMFTSTHLRMDGIVVGVLISYLYYFTDIHKAFLTHRYIFLAFSCVLLSTVCVFPAGSFFMNAFGIVAINLGFGLIVLLIVVSKHIVNSRIGYIKQMPFAVICFIGVHSYSIYLWHIEARKIVNQISAPWLTPVLFLTIPLLVGIVLSYSIEKPFLKLREVLCP